MHYKILFTDLDGTLISDSMKVSERTINIIKKVKDNLKISIVSGRQKEIVLEYANQLNLDFNQICDGGSRIIDIKGNTIWETFIEKDTAKRIVNIIQQFEIDNYVCSDNGNTLFSIRDIKAWKVSKIAFLARDIENCNKLIELLEAIPNIKFFKTKQAEQSTWNIDITNEFGTKYHGVKKLIEASGVSKASTIGIGDGFNDIPLLQATGLKIAMGNSPDELKKEAALVTHSVFEDGLATAIENLLKQNFLIK